MVGRLREHAFSIELKSKEFLRKVSLRDDVGEKVLIEGYLGQLTEVNVFEDSVLEVRGQNGIIMLDLTPSDLSRIRKATPNERNGL